MVPPGELVVFPGATWSVNISRVPQNTFTGVSRSSTFLLGEWISPSSAVSPTVSSPASKPVRWCCAEVHICSGTSRSGRGAPTMFAWESRTRSSCKATWVPGQSPGIPNEPRQGILSAVLVSDHGAFQSPSASLDFKGIQNPAGTEGSSPSPPGLNIPR